MDRKYDVNLFQNIFILRKPVEKMLMSLEFMGCVA